MQPAYISQSTPFVQTAKMELQASAALQTLASVKQKKQGKSAAPAAVADEAEAEEEQMDTDVAPQGSAAHSTSKEDFDVDETDMQAGTG